MAEAARRMGRWFEEFEVGKIIEHVARFEVLKEVNAAFCALTNNQQPLHLDAAAARALGFRDVLVNGLLTFSAAVGMSVPDTTEGTLIANLGYENVRHPAPVYPGDTLRVVTEVVSSRPSSKAGRGVVGLRHTVSNQSDVVVCVFARTVLVRTRPPGA